MRIAFVTQPWDVVVPPVEGGSIPIVTYQVARRLVGSCQIIVYAKRGHNQQRTQRDDMGIHYRRISLAAESQLVRPFKLLDRLLPFRNSKRPFFASPLYFLGYAMQVANDLRKENPDVVHIHNFSQFAPVIRALNPDSKIVLHMHCEWLTQLDQRMVERRLRRVDLVIGCSDYITQKVRSRFPQFADRCQTMFNGVDPTHFSRDGVTAKNDIKNILYVGRISPEKGVHVLLSAFQQVVKRYPQVRLNIVGPAGSAPFDFIVALDDDDRVSKLASFYSGGIRTDQYLSYLQKQLPTDVMKQVTFAGPVSHSRVLKHYQDADVFVFPSVWDEPFGIPPLEAMACEVPVVATRSGALTEIVKDSETGFLVERDDATALAGAILRLLENEDQRTAMGIAARKRATEYFSWDRAAQTLSHYFQNI